MTNADKIRGMPTDEIGNLLEMCCPPGKNELEFCPQPNPMTASCRDCWIEWLNKEVEE